jgi:hypothetical protein
MLGLALALAAVSVPLVLLGFRIRRTSEKGSPERLLGLLFLLLGLVLAPRLISSRALAEEVTTLWVAVSLTCQFAMAVMSVALVLFTQRVFRPDEPWARRLRDGMIAALLGSGLLAAAQPMGQQEIGVWMIVANVVRTAPFLWVFVECLRYARMMRQRVALGIGDPIVANRFACWSLWTGAMGLAPLCILPLRLYGLSLRAAGQDPRVFAPELHSVAALIAAVTFSAAVVGIWLSFFPPRFWLRRLEISSAHTSASA